MKSLTKAQLVTEIEALRARLVQTERERDEARTTRDLLADKLPAAPRSGFQRSAAQEAARALAMSTGRCVKC